MEWSSWDDPVHHVLTFPVVPGTRWQFKKLEKVNPKPGTPEAQGWTSGLLFLDKGDTVSSFNLCSKFQTCQKSPTSQHTTIYQSKHWHIYTYSFLNNQYVYIWAYCVSVSILSPESYTAKCSDEALMMPRPSLSWWGEEGKMAYQVPLNQQSHLK